jgi:hypothetical protein
MNNSKEEFSDLLINQIFSDHPLSWDSTDFDGSHQDPLRAMVGLRVGF